MTRFKLKLMSPDKTHTFDVSKLAEKLGIPEEELNVSLIMKTDDRGDLIAEAYDDGTYAKIYVDGETDAGRYAIANAELPVLSDPVPVLTGRLYAGNQKTETDIPVVLMNYRDRAPDDSTKRIAWYSNRHVETIPDSRFEKTAATMRQYRKIENRKNS